jgi:hypothetical protein
MESEVFLHTARAARHSAPEPRAPSQIKRLAVGPGHICTPTAKSGPSQRGHRLEDYRKSSFRHQDYLAAVTQDCRCWVRYHLATRTCVQFEGGGIKIVLVAVDGGLVTEKKMRSGEGGGWQCNHVSLLTVATQALSA